MSYRFSLCLLLLASVSLLVLSLGKGLDDLAGLEMRNTLTGYKKSLAAEPESEIALTEDYQSLSLTPFDDDGIQGLYYAWLAYQHRDQFDKQQQLSNLAIQYFTEQLRRRPLDSSLVVHRANQMWRSGEEIKSVLPEFHLAQALGHYERLTLTSSLNYYLSHWPALSLDDKKVAISYLLEHDRYDMKLWQYDGLLQKPIIGERACAIFGFNGIRPYFCRN